MWPVRSKDRPVAGLTPESEGQSPGGGRPEHRTPEEAGRTWGRRALLHDLTRSLSFIFESFSRNITMSCTRDYFTSSFSIFISPLLSLMF